MACKFQFTNVRYQLQGRGVTGKISTLHINGQQVSESRTIDQFYNAMGEQVRSFAYLEWSKKEFTPILLPCKERLKIDRMNNKSPKDKFEQERASSS